MKSRKTKRSILAAVFLTVIAAHAQAAEPEQLETELNVPAAVQPDVPRGFTEFSPAGISVVQEFLDTMEMISTDYRTSYFQFRVGSNEDNSLLGSFSICDPSVDLGEVNFDLEDLTAAANWAIYDEYQFQIGSMSDYTENMPINTEKMNAFFQDEWQDIKNYDFGNGYAVTQDANYYWVPLYYADETENIYDDSLYLFVYIVRPGADMDYLSDKIYYDHYGEFRTEKLLIADPETVAGFLNAVRAENDVFAVTEDTTEYTELSRDYNGEAVKQLQLALYDAGFLSSSADGYYGPLTQEAVSACQEAMGLEANGVADAEFQRRLFSDTEEKNRLLDWLEAHS